MIYIIISDIHSNLEAFRAVVESFPKEEPADIICGGDIVGYGADPDACVDMIRSIGARCVLGNHDAVLAGKMDTSNFNEYAAEAIRWTDKHLTIERRTYLRELSYVLKDKSFQVTHGTLHNPEEFQYMISGADAARTFEILDTKICFVGHTHVPCIFISKDGKIYQSFEREIVLDQDARYIINVGSVGQPRDYNTRASYCIFYPEQNRILFNRVEYDIECARERIIDAGLPRRFGDRLLYGR